MTVLKTDTQNSKLKAKLTEAINAWVRETLEDSSATDSSFLDGLRVKRAHFKKQFRRKFKDRRLLRRIEAMLAGDRLDYLLFRAIQRHQAKVSDPAQLALPGFEHLPRRIRISRSSVPLDKVSVGQLLVFAGGYEKRASRNHLAGEDLLRLAAMIRDQPAEITVAEALARVTGSGVERVVA